jgi:orotidine-5'-phosphate decarboxylase
MSNFADRLLGAVEAKSSHVVVGLDPDFTLLPGPVRDLFPGALADPFELTECYRVFLTDVLDAVADIAVAVKPQLAYFEALGSPGYGLYEELVSEAQYRGLLVIADAKRGDIGSTADAYARAHLDVAGADAVTVNPWFGTDGVEPFLERARAHGKGIFVLVKTSNPSSSEIQDLALVDGRRVSGRVAELVERWGEDCIGDLGYASVGAVVGATHPEELASLRVAHPETPFLVPGYGAQGAGADHLRGAFDKAGTGAVVNSSRAVLYAYRERGGDWRKAARAEADDMRRALWAVARGVTG